MISFAHREPGLGKIWRCRPPLCCTFFPCRHRCCCLLVLCFLCLPRVGQPRVLGLSLSRSMSLSLPVLTAYPHSLSPLSLPTSCPRALAQARPLRRSCTAACTTLDALGAYRSLQGSYPLYATFTLRERRSTLQDYPRLPTASVVVLRRLIHTRIQSTVRSVHHNITNLNTLRPHMCTH
jgi:hypothetical protein